MMGEPDKIDDFITWFAQQPHKYKICIAGNHDLTLDREFIDKNPWVAKWKPIRELLLNVFKAYNIIYLEDESYVIGNTTFYGTPWTPTFGNWAFMGNDDKLNNEYCKIPQCDVLISHGPPYGIGDRVGHENVGSRQLRGVLEVVPPKVCVFGHIHEGYGKYVRKDTDFYNASVVNSQYKVTNKPWVVEVPEKP